MDSRRVCADGAHYWWWCCLPAVAAVPLAATAAAPPPAAAFADVASAYPIYAVEVRDKSCQMTAYGRLQAKRRVGEGV